MKMTQYPEVVLISLLESVWAFILVVNSSVKTNLQMFLSSNLVKFYNYLIKFFLELMEIWK